MSRVPGLCGRVVPSPEDPWASPLYSSNSTFEPRRCARSESMSRSARQTNSQGSSRCAIARQSSGPTPAGSPDVRTIRGSAALRVWSPSEFGFHVGFVAQAAQPQLGFFVGLTGANGLDGLPAFQLVGVVVLAP